MKKMKFKDSFSGASFEIIEINKKLLLKKKFSKFSIKELNGFQKQKKFKPTHFNDIIVKSANIKKICNKNNYILMEYSQGLSGSNLVINGNINTHNILNNFLKSYIESIFYNINFVPINKNLYQKKCLEIKKNVLKDNLNIYKKISAQLLKKLETIDYTIAGQCHGDLTLSNIIIEEDNKTIVLIDFLESYNDTPVQDICKIIQDIRFYWSSRFLKGSDFIRAKTFCDYLQPFAIIKKLKIYDLVELEMIMTILRILPYIKLNDKITMNWIKKTFLMINRSFIKSL